MPDDSAVLQMIRTLPMVDALYDEAFRVAHSGGGHAPEYFVKRVNTYIKKTMESTGDELLDGLGVEVGEDQSNDQKMEQVVSVAAELRAYIRQRIGLNLASPKGTIYQLAPEYNGCHFAAPKSSHQPSGEGGQSEEATEE